jgi:hypothetical protein
MESAMSHKMQIFKAGINLKIGPEPKEITISGSGCFFKIPNYLRIPLVRKQQRMGLT